MTEETHIERQDGDKASIETDALDRQDERSRSSGSVKLELSDDNNKVFVTKTGKLYHRGNECSFVRA